MLCFTLHYIHPLTRHSLHNFGHGFASHTVGSHCSYLSIVLVIHHFFVFFFFFFQAEDGIRDLIVTGVQTCALPISCLSLKAPWQILRRRIPHGPLRGPSNAAIYLLCRCISPLSKPPTCPRPWPPMRCWGNDRSQWRKSTLRTLPVWIKSRGFFPGLREGPSRVRRRPAFRSFSFDIILTKKISL